MPLLICFDAFNTLFEPKEPVNKQYADVARSYGMTGFTDDNVAETFKKAFKYQAKTHPNYGKATGMGPTKWWSDIIINTFVPFLPQEQKLPEGLVENLIQRFWCDEGYVLVSDVKPALQKLREAQEDDGQKIVVGVITNSDDRVPKILEHLGIRGALQTYGIDTDPNSMRLADYDIHFHVMSYDVGVEKPDPRIFKAAEEMLETTLIATGSPKNPAAIGDQLDDHSDGKWHKCYIGDELEKDAIGATRAGWNGFLVDRTESCRDDRVVWVDPKNTQPAADDSIEKPLAFKSLTDVVDWILRKYQIPANQ